MNLDTRTTIRNPLKPSGSVCTTKFNIKKLRPLAHIFIFVSYGSYNKQRLLFTVDVMCFL
jgi:hypothetical protein